MAFRCSTCFRGWVENPAKRCVQCVRAGNIAGPGHLERLRTATTLDFQSLLLRAEIEARFGIAAARINSLIQEPDMIAAISREAHLAWVERDDDAREMADGYFSADPGDLTQFDVPFGIFRAGGEVRAVGEHGAVVITGRNGLSRSGDLGVAVTGTSGTALVGDGGIAVAGAGGTAICGKFGRAIAGPNGTARGLLGAQVSVGQGGTIEVLVAADSDGFYTRRAVAGDDVLPDALYVATRDAWRLLPDDTPLPMLAPVCGN